MVKEMHYQENTLFDLDPKVKGVKVARNNAQYPRHHVSYAPAKFDVPQPMVKDKMHLQENTLFDLDLQGHTKCCTVPSTSCDLCTKV